MGRCFALAHRLYQADGILSHEFVATELARFLWAQIQGAPETSSRAALLSVVNSEYRTATYLSCGRKLIVGALANLLRLALPYADRDGYRPEWAPDA